MFGRDVYIFLSKSGSGFYMGSESGLMGGLNINLKIPSFVIFGLT